MKAVLFDLDGTLLPMDQDVFVKAYFGLLAKKMAPYGYDPQLLIKGIWAGTASMVKNDGSTTNEEAFWKTFAQVMGDPEIRRHEPVFEEFYREDFQQVRSSCGYAEEAAEVVNMLKEKGVPVILATNPLFPAIATQSRIRWAGLEPEAFESYTTYEHTHYCKPNPAYYREILEKHSLDPADCLMVGNDVGEDMVAKQRGMDVFLLTHCLINKEETDISQYPNGGFTELKEYLMKHLEEK